MNLLPQRKAVLPIIITLLASVVKLVQLVERKLSLIRW